MKKWKGWLIGALCVTASAFTLFGCDDGKEGDTPDNHEHNYVSTVTAATCTEGGYTTYTCECGDSYIAEETAAFGHTFDNDCTTDDKCANCDTTASANGAHTFDNDCTTADKCANCDTTASANGAHEFDNDCTTDDKCANCGATAGVKEHIFDNDCTTADKCANCDTTAEKKEGHTFVNGICEECGCEQAYKRVNANGAETATGKYILFGSYPQSEVKDSVLTGVLTTTAGTLPVDGNAYAWTSYGYYINGSNAIDYMWYQDVAYNGEEYRGVYFTSYRPNYTEDYDSSTTDSNQDDNGYYISEVYWFRYEPIQWRILTEEGGYATLLCEMIVDSQDYNYTYNRQTIDGETAYGNNYEQSTIRKWLNDTFYNTAFSALEQAIIQTVTVDNSATTTGDDNSIFACNDTEDKVWLLSYADLLNAKYGFNTDKTKSDELKQKQTSDYAKCQGCVTSTSASFGGNGLWWTRSPAYEMEKFVRYVYAGGNLSNSYYCVDGTCIGVVPALKIRL